MKALLANFSIGREVLGRVRSMLRPGGNGTPALSLELTDIPHPVLLSPDWVRIRTIMSGISDLDVGLLSGGNPGALGSVMSFPFVPGNENLGIVIEAGDNVEGIEIGQRVIVNPVLSCEPRAVDPVCTSCAAGYPSRCRNFAQGLLTPGMVIGTCRDTAGGWADSFIAHRSQIRAIPHSVESDEAILIPEFARAVHAVLQHRPEPEDRVLVCGGGSLGLLMLHALKALELGSRPIFVTEEPFEAEIAQRLFPADCVVRLGAGSAYEEIAELLEARVRYPEIGRLTLEGGADLVFETRGAKTSLEDAVNFTGEGKRLVLTSMRGAGHIDASPLLFKDILARAVSFTGMTTYNGSRASSFDIAMEPDILNGIPYAEIITHRFKADQFKDVLPVLTDRSASKAIKAIFQHVV
jgi:threonine dehydrogenase-like Zn-dependent dehydrogenase